MIIKGAPIIHARTFHVDFRSKLLIRPFFFSDADAEYCYQIAIDSTTFRELAPKEGRTVYYAKGDFVIVGKTAVFSDLFSICNIPQQFDRVDNENGRYAYGFVGAAFKRSDIRVPFLIKDEEILKIYIDGIASRWNEEYGKNDVFASQISNETEIDVRELSGSGMDFFTLIQQSNSKIVIDDTSENRKNLLIAAYNLASTGQDFALCTSLYTEKAIRDSCFNIVTCKNASQVVLENISEEKSTENEIIGGQIQQRKNRTGYNAVLENCRVPIDDELGPKRTESTNDNALDLQNNRKIRETEYHRNSLSGKEQSLDDILEQNVAPSKIDGKEARFRAKYSTTDSKGSNPISPSQECNNLPEFLKSMGFVIGSIAGIIILVVEASLKASPIVLAFTGLCTIVFVGLEAKKIIDKCIK